MTSAVCGAHGCRIAFISEVPSMYAFDHHLGEPTTPPKVARRKIDSSTDSHQGAMAHHRPSQEQ